MVTEINHQERDHYLNGGSVIGRRKACPASLFAEQKYPDKSTQASEEGTKVHECIEILIDFAIANWDKPNKFRGSPKLLDNYTEEQIRAAKLACENIIELMGDKVPNIGWVKEQKFIIDANLQLGGTVDMCWGYKEKGKKIGHIWDYKNGIVPVDAETTMQLKQYAAALQVTLGKKEPFDEIHGHIFQPNSKNKNKIATHTVYDKIEIDRILVEQKEIAEIALGLRGEEFLVFNAGAHCQFCKAKFECNAAHNYTYKNSIEVLDLHDARKELITKKQLPPAKELVKTISDEQLLNFYSHIDYLKAIISAVDEHIKERAKTGKPIPGLKCVYGTPKRQWPKDVSVLELGKQLKTIGIEKPWEKKLITIAEATEALMDLGNDKEAAKNLLAPFVALSKAPISIVLDSEGDGRPAIDFVDSISAAAILDAVD